MIGCVFCYEQVIWNVQHLCIDCDGVKEERNEIIISKMMKFFRENNLENIWNCISIEKQLLISMGKIQLLACLGLDKEIIATFCNMIGPMWKKIMETVDAVNKNQIDLYDLFSVNT